VAHKKLKYWFDDALARRLADDIAKHYQPFDVQGFVERVSAGVGALELKGRVALFADRLRDHLPPGYPDALDILLQILGPENPKETGMFAEYYWVMPIAAFVERYGLEDFDASMRAIAAITKRNTGEYCIRPFIERYPERTLGMMSAWATDANVHLRRLASEGLRPRLPWSRKLDRFIEDPRPIIAVIENLKDDPSRFVQKSVANNLNDILKDNPDLGLETLRRWSPDATPARRWIIGHALRNLTKKGDRAAGEIRILAGIA
jgi:3-methyladenine DNA glycosylase AlkC